jgi:hypothetical protein
MIDTSQMTPQELETHKLKEFFCRNLAEVGIYAEPTESLTQLINKLRWLRLRPEYGPEFHERLILPGGTAEVLRRNAAGVQALSSAILALNTSWVPVTTFNYGKFTSATAATTIPHRNLLPYELINIASLTNTASTGTVTAANPQTFTFSNAFQQVRTTAGRDVADTDIKLLAMTMTGFGSSNVATAGTVYYNHGILHSPLTLDFESMPVRPTHDRSTKTWLSAPALSIAATSSANPYVFLDAVGGFAMRIPFTMPNYTGYTILRANPVFSDFWFIIPNDPK